MNNPVNKKDNSAVDWKGLPVFLITLLLTTGYFWYSSDDFIDSFFAGLLTAGLVWATYVIMRILTIVAKK